MMAEALVIFQERDIRGAILPEKVVDRNSVAALRRWILCRGLTSTVADSHAMMLVYTCQKVIIFYAATVLIDMEPLIFYMNCN